MRFEQYANKTKLVWSGCSGTILNEQYVLSAAHCAKPTYFNYSFPPPTHVVVKEHNITDDSDGQSVANICNWTVHDSYEKKTIRFDFAIASLKQPIVFDDKAAPACLPVPWEMRQDDFFVGKTLTASGWGDLGYGLGDSDVLMKVDLIAQSNDDCNKVFLGKDNVSRIYPEMLCAGGRKATPTQAVCHGDSGGPLTYTNEKGVTTVVGVVSWGKGACPGLPYPGVFSRVTSVLNWITETMHKDVRQCYL